MHNHEFLFLFTSRNYLPNNNLHSLAEWQTQVKNIFMGTAKETKSLDADQLSEWANRLRLVATRIENAADLLRESDCAVDVANWKSGELGVKNFLAFSAAIHASIDQMLLNIPPAPKKTKPQKKQT